MPYIQKWVEPAKNPNLKVFPELPEGFKKVERKFTFVDYEIASKSGSDFDLPVNTLHHCPKCAGWVEGKANEYRVDNLDGRHLSGRRGTDYHCARCGHKLGFFGVMS